ncbi:TonB-dependent receptor [Fodinibius salsisoli]|uniref:TonB-dependent receptor n=1 Tax=Fodinibius salsisoli TaxID=2820877 RepID=A0ABT3PHP4_9BACT|nr:TonB-dependent receptor [Fodinibius salsisoli]MCW9705440.1 TonB-dependent receptor [Fodinibius salsisoli]
MTLPARYSYPLSGLLLLTLLLAFPFLSSAQQQATIEGRVVNESAEPLTGINVALEGTRWGATTNANGRYSIRNIAAGNYTIVASSIGFQTRKEELSLNAGQTHTWNITLQQAAYNLDAVTVSGKSELREVEEKAFNVDVVNAKKLHATTLDLGHALDRVSGVRVRESGGVGSRMNFSMNGFTGNQVKFFVDGIPIDNFGSSFQLNNIPVNYAERIEVYKGVVPVGLGADALGGAVNVITNRYQQTHADVSYSYGSFNTHRTNANLVYVAESGFTAQINAFQNYSDNNYDITVDVADIETGAYDKNREVERFNDTYHNETVIANLGVVNKSFADRLLVGITLGQNYDEIQTGARQVSVFGDWHRKGNLIMPTLKYQKSDLFTENLDVSLNANYNFGEEQNIDTSHRRYNWLGDYVEYEGPGGERSYSKYKYQNNNGLVTTNWNYQINGRHALSLGNTFNTFSREGHDPLNPDDITNDQPKKTRKNVAGLSYQYSREDWNVSLFTKHYFQKNIYVQSYNPSGDYGDVAYRDRTSNFSKMGYGAAATYFATDNLQLKASYEKSYRLPNSNELFGNLVNLEGNIELDPEKSHNYNLGGSYWMDLGSGHRLNVNQTVFYRDASDFIRTKLNTNQTQQVKDNLGSVTNLGLESQVYYQYQDKLAAGFNLTYQDLRNNTKYVDGRTTESVVYRDRIPNMPYFYGNANAEYTFNNLWQNNHSLSIGYNLLYVHDFYLYWPSLGTNSEKLAIPQQISHDITITYNLGPTNRFQFTLEARNITDERRYDNFSLQKPGRNFSGKVRYSF